MTHTQYVTEYPVQEHLVPIENFTRYKMRVMTMLGGKKRPMFKVLGFQYPSYQRMFRDQSPTLLSQHRSIFLFLFLFFFSRKEHTSIKTTKVSQSITSLQIKTTNLPRLQVLKMTVHTNRESCKTNNQQLLILSKLNQKCILLQYQ